MMLCGLLYCLIALRNCLILYFLHEQDEDRTRPPQEIDSRIEGDVFQHQIQHPIQHTPAVSGDGQVCPKIKLK